MKVYILIEKYMHEETIDKVFSKLQDAIDYQKSCSPNYDIEEHEVIG